MRIAVTGATAFEDTCTPFGIKPPLCRSRMDFFRDDAAFDCSRARRVLGWNPAVELEEGFRRTPESYRQSDRI